MKVLIYSIATILFIVFGFFMHKGFTDFSFSLLNTDGFMLMSSTIAGQSNKLFLFVITIGLLPLLYFLVAKITKISFLYKGLIVSIIIILFGLIFWRLRILGLNAQFEELSSYDLPQELEQNFDIGMLKFEAYILMGFIVGTLVSILVFRDKNKPLLN